MSKNTPVTDERAVRVHLASIDWWLSAVHHIEDMPEAARLDEILGPVG
jgi:hypothetical protein